MKLGSKVGLILSSILILAGITMCIIGSVSASSSGQYLFTQVDENGTYYSQSISADTTKIKLNYENANIVIKGGAEKSQIEFSNFNPNLYTVAVSTNVITFTETPDFKSIMNIMENGFSFKGLRYILDPRNFDYDEYVKTITISVADDSNLKIIDVSAQNSNVIINNLKLSGDLNLSVQSGSIKLDTLSTDSAVNITTNSAYTSINSSKSNIFTFSSNSAQIDVKDSTFDNVDINTDSGKVNYYSPVTLENHIINVSSDTGGMLINSKSVMGSFIHDPSVGNITSDNDELKTYNKFKIKTVSGGIYLEYPQNTAYSEN